MTDGLPIPTTDIELASRDLKEHGYCVLLNALSDDLRDRIRARIIEQAAGERELGIGVTDGVAPENYIGGSGRGEGNNGRVWNLVNKGEVFQNLLTHPEVNRLVAQVLEDPFLLASIQANFVSPGDKPLPIHSDQGYVPRPWPPYALTSSVIWMFDDFTEQNGATTVVPGSHIERGSSDARATINRARLIRKGGIPVCGPSGSALIFDGRIVHGTGVNITDERRLGVLTYFCRPFVRQQENFTLSVRPDVLETLSDEVKAKLGFQVWKTLGSVEGVCAEGSLVRRAEPALGPVDVAGRPTSPAGESAGALR
jgi:ectoine hydroxylase-related dioxygenase (phytanoyl-CoA dioxygenase family)